MSVPSECMRCNGKMKEGFLLDQGHGFQDTKWVEGQPEPSLLFGVKTRGKTRLHVSTYRCTKCGYLESYAS